MALTPEQVWYITRVYPESVNSEEVRADYEREVLLDSERAYWETATKILQHLAMTGLGQDAAEQVFADTDDDARWEAQEQLRLMVDYLNQNADIAHFREFITDYVRQKEIDSA